MKLISSLTHWQRAASLSWALLLIIVAVIINMPGKQGKLYPTFVDAGHHFLHGESLYPVNTTIAKDRDLFRYSPVATLMMIPFDGLPYAFGSILWRWSQAILLVVSLCIWGKQAFPPVAWPGLLLLCLPLCGGNVHNGQVNPLILTLILVSIIAFQAERFWLAALAIAIASAFKGYPIVLGGLFCLIDWKRFLLPFLACCLGIILAPFAVQESSYVLTQYQEWITIISKDDRSLYDLHTGYHNFQRLLLRWGISMSVSEYRILEIIAGLLAAWYLLIGIHYWQWAREKSAYLAGGLAIIWMTLFGPATETATYMLLAPYLVQACLVVRQRASWQRLMIWGAYLLLLSNVVINWFAPPLAHPWLSQVPQAHGSLLWLGWFLWDAARCESRKTEIEMSELTCAHS